MGTVTKPKVSLNTRKKKPEPLNGKKGRGLHDRNERDLRECLSSGEEGWGASERGICKTAGLARTAM